MKRVEGHKDESAFFVSWNCYAKPELPSSKRYVFVIQACDWWSRKHDYPAFGDDDLRGHSFVVVSPKMLGFSRLPDPKNGCMFGEMAAYNCVNLTGEASLYFGQENPPEWISKAIPDLKVTIKGVSKVSEQSAGSASVGVQPEPQGGEGLETGPFHGVMEVVFGDEGAHLFGDGPKVVLLRDSSDNPAGDLLMEAAARILRESDAPLRVRVSNWGEVANDYIPNYNLIWVDVDRDGKDSDGRLKHMLLEFSRGVSAGFLIFRLTDPSTPPKLWDELEQIKGETKNAVRPIILTTRSALPELAWTMWGFHAPETEGRFGEHFNDAKDQFWERLRSFAAEDGGEVPVGNGESFQRVGGPFLNQGPRGEAARG